MTKFCNDTDSQDLKTEHATRKARTILLELYFEIYEF